MFRNKANRKCTNEDECKTRYETLNTEDKVTPEFVLYCTSLKSNAHLQC